MPTSYNQFQINAIAQQIIDRAESNVVLFYGQMGAGKTTLIKAILQNLGVRDITNSPTFSIVNEYIAGEGKTIYHFDFYRLNHEEEALDIGFEEYLHQGDWVFIEWPNKIKSYLPEEYLAVSLDIISNQERSYTLETINLS